MGQSTFQFGTQPQQQSNLFQNQKPANGGFNIFGQPNTTTSNFGQPQQQQTFSPFNSFGKPPQPTFGQPQQQTFGGTGMQSGSLFANSAPKGLFSNTNNLFANTFQPSGGFNIPTQPQQQQQPMLNLHSEINIPESRGFQYAADPYGYHPHLEGLMPTKSPEIYPTNPKEIQKYLDAPQPIAVVPPRSKRLKVMPLAFKKELLFEEDRKPETMNFSLRQSAKRLFIKKSSPGTVPEEIKVVIDGTLVGIDPTSTPLTARGPPLFVPPPRLRAPEILMQSIELDKFSASEFSVSEPPDASAIHYDTKSTKSESTSSSCTNFADEIIDDENDEFEKTLIIEEKEDDTCGITLKRKEYYTVPPLEKLVDHKDADGRCFVKGFTIGRVGYGSVSFPDLMDVSNLNLDELVHFRYRELTIYPDDDSKPPLGHELNRRAQVTLDRVFPKGKKDRKLINDVETLTAINFTETLRELCDKHGTRFLDYRPETGSWVFMVDHFSKYGYSESEDEDDEEVARIIRAQQRKDKEKKDKEKKDQEKKDKERKDQEKKDKEKKDQEKMDQERHDTEAEETENDVDRSESPTEMSILIDDDDDDMLEESELHAESIMSDITDNDMDSPMEAESLDSLHTVKTRRELYKTTGETVFLMKATLFEDPDHEEFVPVNIESDNIETIGKQGGRLMKEYVQPMVIRRHVDRYERPQPRIYQLQNKYYTIPLNKSLYNCRNYMDMAIFKARSFKVGWGRGLVLVTPCQPIVPIDRAIVRKRVEITSIANLTNYDPIGETLPDHLKIIMETSEVKLEGGVPYFSVNKNKTAMMRHLRLAEETFMNTFTRKSDTYFKDILELVVALWGEIPSHETRRQHFSNWCNNVLAKHIDASLKRLRDTNRDSPFELIFTYLTGYQLMEAGDVAMQNNLPNLALLISQTNLTADSKLLLRQQIEQWRTSLSLDFVDEIIQKIYMLLSGLLLQADGTDVFKDLVNICEDLHWRQCVGVMLWYVTGSDQPIEAAIQLYTKAFETDYTAARPLSALLGENTDIFDIQYCLMLLYCNNNKPVEEILDPLTHSNYGADFRISWILLQTIRALNIGAITEASINVLSTSFSIQLESLGLPKWAIFVLLFIKDPSVRKNLVMRTLHRILTHSTSSALENELVKDLSIPSEWIHEVKSYKTQLLDMHWQSYRHLALSRHWQESHRIAMESIIPGLIINERYVVLKGILENLQHGKDYISDWRNHGGLLLEFLKIVDLFNNNDLEINKEDALKVHSALLELCGRLRVYPMNTHKQIAALSEISKRCYIFAKLLINIIKPIYRGIALVTNMETERLVMPPDYIFNDLINGAFLMDLE